MLGGRVCLSGGFTAQLRQLLLLDGRGLCRGAGRAAARNALCPSLPYPGILWTVQAPEAFHGSRTEPYLADVPTSEIPDSQLNLIALQKALDYSS